MSLKEKLKRLSARKHDALTSDERASMKREFSAFMDAHPLKDERRAAIVRVSTPSPFAAWMQPSYAALGLAVAAVFTVGVSEFSLPTDSLYSVKTGVNERVLLASTYFSPVLHAQAEHTVFSRRLEEAEQLMLLAQFRAETADEIQTDIDRHAEALNRSIARAETAGEIEEVTELRAEFAATLEEYDPLLDILALRKEVEDTAIIDSFIAEVVEEHAGSLKPEAAAEAFDDIKYEIMDEYADEMLEELESLNAAVSERVAASDADAETVIVESIADELAASNDARADAEAALRDKDPETALEHLETAITATESALDQIPAASESEI